MKLYWLIMFFYSQEIPQYRLKWVRVYARNYIYALSAVLLTCSGHSSHSGRARCIIVDMSRSQETGESHIDVDMSCSQGTGESHIIVDISTSSELCAS